MILTVLGGSAAGPNTGAGCAGFLVTHGTTSLVLDLGPGTLLELRKHIDFREITAVLITHYHLDHMADLGALRYSLAYNPVPAGRKPRLLMPPGSPEKFARWATAFGHDGGFAFFSDYFDCIEYPPEAIMSLPGLEISFAATVHEAQGWAIRIDDDTGRSLGYTADTGPTADLSRHLAGVDLLIAEATEVDNPVGDDPKRGHLRAEEAGQLAEDVSAACLMLTHIWEEDDRARAMGLAATRFDGPIIDARPGTRVHP